MAKQLGRWAYVGGGLLALSWGTGILSKFAPALTDATAASIIALAGVAAGFMNVSRREEVEYLARVGWLGLALVVASLLPIVGGLLSSVLFALGVFAVGAAIPVAIRGLPRLQKILRN